MRQKEGNEEEEKAKDSYKKIVETLPEAQRAQGIESITQIITHGKKYFRGEMKYMSDYKNQAWSLKLEKSVRTGSDNCDYNFGTFLLKMTRKYHII